MDKTLIKEVSYCPQSKWLMVEFKDGSKFGESGEIAKRTFEKLNKDEVRIIDIKKRRDEKNRAAAG